MKKAVKIFTAITAAAVAVAGAVYVVRKFFLHDDELEEFDDEELFEDEDDDSDDDGIEAFDDGCRRQNPGSCASKMGEKCQSYLYAGAGRTKRADHKRKLSGIG